MPSSTVVVVEGGGWKVRVARPMSCSFACTPVHSVSVARSSDMQDVDGAHHPAMVEEE